MAKTFKMLSDKMSRTSDQYIGTEGDLILDPQTGELKVTDGLRPGGHSVGIRAVQDELTTARTAYEAAVAGWYAMLEAETHYAGHPWFSWKDVNGETADDYNALLTTWWNQQSAPTSPPTPLDMLPMQPPISQAYYNELRTALTAVSSTYDDYVTAHSNKEIVGSSLKVPEVIETTLEEDLVINVRYTTPGSGSGSEPVTVTKTFTLKTNGTLLLPDGSVAISTQALKNIAGSSADFAEFKSVIAAL